MGTLDELGEFRILREILFPTAARHGSVRLGDDCAFFDVGSAVLAISADVGPDPLVRCLPGFGEALAAAGWHAAAATASDIATSGAKPLFMVDTLDAPADFRADALASYVDGYFQACARFGFEAVGGDIRRGDRLAMRVFGVGQVEHGQRIGRSGAQAGDRLVAVGHCGRFITSYLRLERAEGIAGLEPDVSTISFPVPPVSEMRSLASQIRIAAASDSSDGVLGAIANISDRSRCGFRLELTDELLSTDLAYEAAIRGLDPWNLFFFWGDWSTIAAIPAHEYEAFRSVALEQRIPWVSLGFATTDRSVTAIVGEKGPVRQINIVRNENFLPDSFNSSISSHVDYMLHADLWEAGAKDS